jgi:hypothetical protein
MQMPMSVPPVPVKVDLPVAAVMAIVIPVMAIVATEVMASPISNSTGLRPIFDLHSMSCRACGQLDGRSRNCAEAEQHNGDGPERVYHLSHGFILMFETSAIRSMIANAGNSSHVPPFHLNIG